MTLRIFIGMDERQPLAYNVCRASIARTGVREIAQLAASEAPVSLVKNKLRREEHRHMYGTVSWTELMGRSVHARHMRPR